MNRGGRTLIFILYLVVALYSLNYPFQILKIPQYISIADPWIIFVSGVLLVLGGISFYRVGRRYY
jgi:hypothetical protein